MLKKMNSESRVFGFLMGPHGVYSNNYIEIDAEYMNLYRNMGGFDMICKFLFLLYIKCSLSNQTFEFEIKEVHE